MSKTALIFGVTGQVGSYLAELLLSKGYHVTGVARRVSGDSTGRLKAVSQWGEFQLVGGDITDPFCVYRLLNEHLPHEIYNLAAQSHVKVSFEEPSHTWDVTAKGVLNILEALRHLQNEWGAPRRFFQASSSEMFGSCFSVRNRVTNELPQSDGDAVARRLPNGSHEVEESYQNESTSMIPNSPYAVAKLAAHNMVKLYRDAYGLHASCGIMFNMESPRRGEDFVTRKIAKWAAKLYAEWQWQGFPDLMYLIQDETLRIKLGNLDAKRDWGYVPDYVQAMYLMLQQDKPDDYVVATGETHSVREFLWESVKCIKGIAEGNEEIGEDELEWFAEVDKNLFRPKEVPYLRGDASKAREKLGWKPTTTFKDLVREMVQAELVS